MKISGPNVFDVDKIKEVNTAEWEYQTSDNSWSNKSWKTYPKTICLLIERQWSNQQGISQNLRKYSPIFYQSGTGYKYKINLSTQLQFDLQNGSVVMIRRKNQGISYKYNKCPECLFKLSLNAKVCGICSTDIQQYLFKQFTDKSKVKQPQINNNNNNNNDDIKMSDYSNKNDKNNDNDKKNNDNNDKKVDNIKTDDPSTVSCPFCQTNNKVGFNFCVGCSFDLRDYQQQQQGNPKPINDKNKNKDMDNKANNVVDINNNNDKNDNNDKNNDDIDFNPFADDLFNVGSNDNNKDNSNNNNNDNSNNNINNNNNDIQPGGPGSSGFIKIDSDNDQVMEGDEGVNKLDNNNNNNNIKIT